VNPRELFSTAKFKALLFDCDGTIAHSMPVHLRAWNQALQPWGAQLSEFDHEKFAGVPTPRIVEILNEANNLTMPVEKMTFEKEQAYLRLMHEVTAVPDVLKTIEAFSGVLPMAVVSGSPRASLVKTLKHLGLLEMFGAVLGCDEYPNGKPAPDGYLLAAQQLGVAPSECLVFEDGALGIQAAQAAAMKWVRVVPAQGGFDLAHSDF
jgi:HAD superfamily hydrolase (TIGR01509 family)